MHFTLIVSEGEDSQKKHNESDEYFACESLRTMVHIRLLVLAVLLRNQVVHSFNHFLEVTLS